RDLVPFPMTTFPLFVVRKKTINALEQALAGNREVVLALQVNADTEEPHIDNLYSIAVIAKLLEMERLAEAAILMDLQFPQGGMKIQVMAHRRVIIRRFAERAGAFWAQFDEVCEGPIRNAPDVVQHAVDQFEAYAETHEVKAPPQMRANLGQIRDPGRLADA